MQQILQMFGKDRLWITRDQIITIMEIIIIIITAAMAAVAMEIMAAMVERTTNNGQLNHGICSGFSHRVIYH